MLPLNLTRQSGKQQLPAPADYTSSVLVDALGKMERGFVESVSDWDDARRIIIETPALSIADLALKVVALLHEIAPAQVAGKLAFDCEHAVSNDCARLGASLLNDARRLASIELKPKERGDLLVSYRRAKTRENKHYTAVYEPAIEASGAPIAHVDAEYEMLCVERYLFEDALIRCPSATADDLAMKYVICRDHKREYDWGDDQLLAEAKHFAGKNRP